MLKTLGRRIWIDETQWNRIGMIANYLCIMVLQFLADLVMEAIDRGEYHLTSNSLNPINTLVAHERKYVTVRWLV